MPICVKQNLVTVHVANIARLFVIFSIFYAIVTFIPDFKARDNLLTPVTTCPSAILTVADVLGSWNDRKTAHKATKALLRCLWVTGLHGKLEMRFTLPILPLANRLRH